MAKVQLGHDQGYVINVSEDGLRVKVNFGNEAVWCDTARLDSGFRVGDLVTEMPTGLAGSNSLGDGVVRGVRSYCGRTQLLVEFESNAQSKWLRWEQLVLRPSIEKQYVAGIGLKDKSQEYLKRFTPERARLKLLAHAIEKWNFNSGSLLDLDIDPLPHQIQLVHHILKSGNLNWMIADDVGLGKTIEVGLLLKILLSRSSFNRVLVVCPASLTIQWQEEMAEKFGIDNFAVYKTDFNINSNSSWHSQQLVIGSIDSLKIDEKLEALASGPYWDLVIFDEAHRLTRVEVGLQYKSSDRFKLASVLRNKTDNLLLLTATPHQGKNDKFKSLLELLRPEWVNEFSADNLPGVIRECVFRNKKSECVGQDGALLFKGKKVLAIEHVPTEFEYKFERSLQRYIKEGYKAAERMGHSGFAIGFVMTVFRKLATSSIYALLCSLEKRLARIEGAQGEGLINVESASDVDERYEGENEVEELERTVEFFEDEKRLLSELVSEGKSISVSESKFDFLVDDLIIGKISKTLGRSSKVVIFTEFRNTQSRLITLLESRFGLGSCRLINGSQKIEEKILNVSEWNASDSVRFLISTEAGSEGINLQENCSVMINFDLPWNPMRLVQRIGRLDRYGQKSQVVVFNLAVKGFADTEILNVLYQRLYQVSEDLSSLSSEYHDNIEEEIIGQVASIAGADIENVLKESYLFEHERTKSEVEDSIQKAKDSARLQEEMFQSVQGFDPKALDDQLSVDEQMVLSFVKGVLVDRFGFVDSHFEYLHGRKALGFSLDDSPFYHSELERVFGQKINFRVTADRAVSNKYKTIDFLSSDHPLLCFLLDVSKSFSFGGFFASFDSSSGRALSLQSSLLRWVDLRGNLAREELLIAEIDKQGNKCVNGSFAKEWLSSESRFGFMPSRYEEDVRSLMTKAGDQVEQDELVARSSDFLLPVQNKKISIVEVND